MFKFLKRMFCVPPEIVHALYELNEPQAEAPQNTIVCEIDNPLDRLAAKLAIATYLRDKFNFDNPPGHGLLDMFEPEALAAELSSDETEEHLLLALLLNPSANSEAFMYSRGFGPEDFEGAFQFITL